MDLVSFSKEAQDVFDRYTNTFIKGGYWWVSAQQDGFVWVEHTDGVSIWERDFGAAGAPLNIGFVFGKNSNTVDRFRPILSSLNVNAGVQTRAAMAAQSVLDSINQLVKALEAGGYSALTLSGPIDIKAQRKKDGTCPECGGKGEWRAMALVCPAHGKFIG